MMLTLPAAQALRIAFPSSRISMLASSANHVAARHHPGIDHVELDPLQAKDSGLRGVSALARQVRSLECDAAVIFHPTPRLALAIWRAGIPVRVGTAYRAYSFLFNRRVRQHRRKSPSHESTLNVAMLKGLGIQDPETHPVRWQVTPEEQAAADAVLAEHRVLRRFIVLHPGNAGSALNWSAERYAALGRRLAGPGLSIVITGGPQELALSAGVAHGIGSETIDLGGKTSLPVLAALLQRAALYIGSATGPTHLAAAVGTPVVGLYSPLRSSAPSRWRPLGDRVQILQPALDLQCPRCVGEECPHWQCMDRNLSVERVERAAREILDEG